MPVVSVHDRRSGSAPLTWGQRSILRIMLMLGEQVHTTNLGSWARLPDGTDTTAALRWIGRLVETYESLRTRYVPSADDWLQVLDGSGEVAVEIVDVEEAETAATARRLQAEMRRTAFKISEEWQIRFRILATGDRAHGIVWTSSHLVADLRSMWAVNAAIAQFGGELAAGVQPLDQVVYEESEAGRSEDRRAIEHWRQHLTVPESLAALPADRAPHDGSIFWYGRFESRTLTAVLTSLGERHRITTSTVLLAGVAATLASMNGQDRMVMTVVAPNRTRRGTRPAVGTFSQLVPLSIPVAGLDAEALIRGAASANLLALRRGAYDPRHLEALRAGQQGPTPDLSITFNDIRPATQVPVAPPAALSRAPRGVFTWTGQNNEGDSTAFFWVWSGRDGETGVNLMLDTRRVSLTDGERILADAEELLIRMAGEH